MKNSKDLAISYATQKASRKNVRGPLNPKLQQSKAPMNDSDQHYDSIADAIMRKQQYAAGGMVDPNGPDEESGQAPYNEYNADAFDELISDTDQLDDEPTNSIGDPEESDDEDENDLVSSIRRKYKK